MSEHRRLTGLLRSSRDPAPLSVEELLKFLQRIHSVAVVGLSRDPMKAARRVPSYLAAKGFDVLPVNPNAERVLGRTSHPELGAVAQPVDLVLVFRPSEEAGGVVRQAMTRTETPGIWLQEGILALEAVREARERGFTVVQDLCIYKCLRALGEYAPRPMAELRG